MFGSCRGPRFARRAGAILAIVTFALGNPSVLTAQEESEDAPVAAPESAPAAPAKADAEPKEAAAGGQDSNVTQESFLVYTYKASPTFFWLMLAISIYMVTNLVNNFLKLKLPKVIPPPLVANLDAMLGEKKYKEAYELLRADKSLFARSLTAGVERLSHGFDRGAEAMFNVAQDGKMEMEHGISPVATVGTVAPMVGLLGTVLGMILAFQQISQGGQPKPAELAANIGLALVSTMEGLVVAVPAIIFFALYRNRIARLVFEVETVGETYLWRFAGALKK